MHELHGGPEPDLDELVNQMSQVDLLLVEGFKRYPHPKIEVHHQALGKALLQPDDPTIVAVASASKLDGLGVPWLDVNNVGLVADFVFDQCDLKAA